MPPQLKDTIANLSVLAPASRTQMINSVAGTLSSKLVKCIDTHNTASIIFIFQQGADKYVLKAEHGKNSATAREISWYKSIKGRSFIPALMYSHVGVNFSFLVLRHINNAVTFEDVSQSPDYSDEQIWGYLEYAICKNNELFKQSNPVCKSKDDIEAFYLTKYDQRLAESGMFPFLKELFTVPTILINDKIFHTPSWYVQKIREDRRLHDYLTPDRLGLIHGDLHYGNILVGSEGTYFVDPNGALQMPIEYDYGKLLHSVHGCYGQIMKGLYTLERQGEYDYTFHSQWPERHMLMLQRLQALLTEKELLRGMYAEALHFATMLPHHTAKPQETTALYLRCVEIFDELFNRIKMAVFA